MTFDDDDDDDDHAYDNGSAARFRERLALFREDGHPHPDLRHAAHWLFHNNLVHPLLGVLPHQRTVELHELSSAWLNKWELDVQVMPYVPHIHGCKQRAWWLIHNVASHSFIGVCPTGFTFALHDWTASKMNVRGWR